jgi:thioredoxin 1
MTFVTHLDDNNFKEVTASGLTLVDVKAEWCNPCKQLSPIIDQISTEYEGRITVGKLDADESRSTVNDLGVRNIPTVILYKDGEVIDRLAGLVNKSTITEMIEKYL